MVKLTPYEIEDLLYNFIKELPVYARPKIRVGVIDREVELITKFGSPYLDVAINIDDSSFIATYSNDTREENAYSKATDTEQVVKDALDIIRQLIEGGATLHVKKNSKGQIISMRTDVAGRRGETNVYKFGLLSRTKESIEKYPPFKINT